MKLVDGSEWQSSCGRYMNLKGIGENAVDVGFYVYEPEAVDARSSHAAGQVSPPAIEDEAVPSRKRSCVEESNQW